MKICCIASVEEAWTAIRAGASALGLVSEMPSGPGPIKEDLIREIAAQIPPGVASFLLTSLQDAAAIVEQQRRCRVNTIQIVDRLERGSYEEMSAAMPGASLVQVIHVTGEESLDEALRIAPHVNALLLDSGNPSLAVKELGGTGRRHDWAISRRIREQSNAPVFLAGGLRAENIREAVETVGPFALDVCSGVRTGGRLDERKLSAFFSELERC
ncbi:MAG TPA: phosphoribosylanthranilate isomerase [Pyrinomonadaceae bacterium]